MNEDTEITAPMMELLAQNRHWIPIAAVVLPILVMWFMGAILAGWVATQKHRSGSGWFVNALIFSPLLALLALAAVPALRARQDDDRGDWDDETARIRRSGRRIREGPSG